MQRLKMALCALSLGLAATSIAPTLAQEGDIVVSAPVRELPGGVLIASRVISYADLDLAYARDRAELDRRIAVSVRDVCNRVRLAADGPVMNSDCENGARRTAYRQISAVQLGG